LSIRTALSVALALALATAGRASGQEPTRITGRVTDSDNKPIVSAQVVVTGTSIGAATNDSGTFALRLPSDARSLTVRRIGFIAKTIPLTPGSTVYNVSLAKDVLQLEKTVITGVATTQSNKNSVTFDPTVSASQLNGAPTPTVENALQGKVPGATIEQNSGAPGGGLQVSIRGVTSIYGNSQPLYVVDGVVMSNATFESGLNTLTNAAGATNQPTDQDQSVNRIADLNPNDIESIQVLTSAAAASVYGSEAAGGVILITTKKGVAGKPQVDASQKFGTFNLEHELDLRHFTLAQAYAQGTGVGLDSAQVLQSYQDCKGFCDAQKGLYGGGELSYESDVSVRGGGVNTTYFLSGLTKYDNGANLNTGYNKQSARASITQTLFGTITSSASIAYTSSLTRRGINGNDNLGIAGYDVISYTPSWFNLNAKNPDGTYVTNPFGSQDNPFQDAQRARTPEEVNRTTIGGNIDWKAFSGEHYSLHLVLNGGADFANVHDQFYLPPDEGVELGPLVNPALRGVSTYQASYNRKSNYSVSLIHNYTGISWLNATTSIGLFRDKDAAYQNNNTGTSCLPGLQSYVYCAVQTPYYAQFETNNQSYNAQEQLVLFDRLSLTGGVNAERSSNDGGVNRYYVYPKLAGAYRIPGFIDGIDEIKVRVAYGATGKIPIDGIKYTAVDLSTYSGQIGLNYDGTAGNKDIKPETDRDYEGGLDFILFHSRMSLSATVYDKVVTDLLLQDFVAPSLGYTSQWINGGQLSNHGLEIQLNATPVQSGRFSWLTTESFARNYARMDKLPVAPFEAGASFGYFPFGGYQIQQGADPNAIWGYRNVNGAAGPLTQIGNSAPAFTLGFSNDFNFGPVHLHMFWDWREGQSTVDLTQNYFDGNGTLADTAGSARRLGDEAIGVTGYTQRSSFLKLRELTGRFDLPMGLVNSVGHGYLRTASISLSGRNLVTFTHYQGLDPEVSNFGAQNFGRGQDVTPYPPTRSYFVSLDLGF